MSLLKVLVLTMTLVGRCYATESLCPVLFTNKASSDPSLNVSLATMHHLLSIQKESELTRELIWKPTDLDGGLEKWLVRGIPPEVQPVAAGGRVYRHYTRSIESLKSILASSRLESAVVPYVRIQPHLARESYTNLTGAFLTLPEAKPDSIGLGSDVDHYVDVLLFHNTPLLQLEKDSIYMVPLPKAVPRWMKDIYQRHLRGETLSTAEQAAVDEMIDGGGTGQTVSIPVEVVGSSLR